jgi:hypothetical protein
MGTDGVRLLLDRGLQFLYGARSISLAKQRDSQVVVSFPVLVLQLETGFESRDGARRSIRLSV